MSAIWTIAGKELRSLFHAPTAWLILAMIEFVLGYLFLIQLEAFLQNQSRLAGIPDAPGVTEIVISGLLGSTAVVLMMIVPILTMRCISEERRAQTLTVLTSSPVTLTEIVLGKYLGVMAFLGIVLTLLLLMPLSLLLGGRLDWLLIGANLIGLFLLLASFAALGLYLSCLCAQPMIAAVSSFGLLLLLWFIDWAGETGGGATSGLLQQLSTLRHYENFLRGLVDTQDVVYFVLFIGTFLILSVRRLDRERLGA